MRRIIPIALTIAFLLLTPSLVSAWWYRDIEVEKDISESLIAGSTDSIIVTFKNPKKRMGSLIAKLNVTESTGDYSVWLGDFEVRAVLKSTSMYPGNVYNISEMTCKEKENGTFYCFNLTDIRKIKCIDLDGRKICFTKTKASYIVLPKSTNELTFHITFNPALIPSDYTFEVGLFNELRVPRIKDPVENTTQADVPTLFDTSEVDTLLWITTNENQSLSVDVILYEFVIEEEYAPVDLIPIKFVGIDANNTKNITSVDIRIYYNETEMPAWVDESSLRLYHYDDSSEDPEEWGWKSVANSGVNAEENYVWATLDHLSLFGIFGSSSREVVYVPGPTTYLPGGVVYRDATQNVTEEEEKIVNITVEVPAEAVCGNGYCESGETCSNCPEDCSCPVGQECVDDVCTSVLTTTTTIPAPIGITGRFVAFVSNPLYATILALTVIAIASAVFRFKFLPRMRRKRK